MQLEVLLILELPLKKISIFIWLSQLPWRCNTMGQGLTRCWQSSVFSLWCPLPSVFVQFFFFRLQEQGFSCLLCLEVLSTLQALREMNKEW